MIYYELSGVTQAPNWCLTVPPRLPAGQQNVWNFLSCRRTDEQKVYVSVARAGDMTPVNLSRGYEVPVISKEAAELICATAVGSFQRIAASIDGDLNWEILNVLEEVDAIDYERSDIDCHPISHNRKPGEPQTVFHLVIDESKIPGVDLFRLNGWPIPLIASERIVDLMDEHQFIHRDRLKTVPTSRAQLGRLRRNVSGKFVSWSAAERTEWLNAHKNGEAAKD